MAWKSIVYTEVCSLGASLFLYTGSSILVFFGVNAADGFVLGLIGILYALLSVLLPVSVVFYVWTALVDPGYLNGMRRCTVIHSEHCDSKVSPNPHEQLHTRSVSTQPFNLEGIGQEPHDDGAIQPEDLGSREVSFSAEDEAEDAAEHSQDSIQEPCHQQENRVEIIVENRYCPICSIEQPLRSKHCNSCNACVALYDHHCPWLGTCIGEWNRRVFWWYLFFTTALLWFAVALLAISLDSAEDLKSFFATNFIQVAGLTLIGVLALLVTALLVVHTYLALTNRTTWELSSWKRISYLQQWPRHLGSPFTRGVRENARFFWLERRQTEPTLWTMPRFVPMQEAAELVA